MQTTSTGRIAARALLASAFLLIAGCASTHAPSSWRDPTDKAGPVKKIVVFVATPDDAVRRLAETRAVQSLPSGTVGVPSFTLFDKPETNVEKVKARLTKEGFDAALIARLVSHDSTRSYVPPETQIVQPYPFRAYAPYYRSFYAYYPQAYTFTTPRYLSEGLRYIVETLLYRLPEGKPVWSAVSDTVNPDSDIVLVDQVVRAVRRDLPREGVIARKPR